MIESIKGLSSIDFIANQGVNEVVAVTQASPVGFIKLHNWRYSRDGTRLEKRGGLYQQALIAGDLPIYGYATYYNTTPVFCELAVTSTAVWRKVGAGAWTSIHTFGAAIAHPVKPFEVNGRIYVLTEAAADRIMILSTGTKVAAGITAPTSIPTITASYDSTIVSDDFAAIGSWVDADAGAGASSQAAYDGRTTLKLLNTGAAGDIAARYQDFANIGPIYAVELTLNIKTMGVRSATNYFYMSIRNGRTNFNFCIDNADCYVYTGGAWVSCGATITLNKWVKYQFYVNTSLTGEEYVEVFQDNVSLGQFYCVDPATTLPGRVYLEAHGESVATEVYVDKIQLGQQTGGRLIGLYRYAVAYRRSGNFGEVSNPIKSKIGTVTFTGAGLNDMTVSGEYTGEKDRTIRVHVDSNPPPLAVDTFKWSEDGGLTWNTTLVNMGAKVFLPWGLEINFAALTGHTIGNYWEFTASSMAVVAVNQTVSLSALPVSADPQVDQKDIYRTYAGGTEYYLLATIPNAQTTFKDNMSQATLGMAMKEDRDLIPAGKFHAWWDDRLWVCNPDDNIVYYSDINYPEAFDILNRYVNFKIGDLDDCVTGLIEYRGFLFVFKRKSIFMIRKRANGGYSRFLVCKDFGCIAPWSLQETFGLLTFLSFRGWEVFNGCEGFSTLFGLPVDTTIRSADRNYLDTIVSCNDIGFNEVWLTIPNRVDKAAAITVVCNYLKGQCFYTFSFHKTPSVLVEARDSNGDIQLYVGTSDGYVFKADSGTQDGTTNISAELHTAYFKHDAVRAQHRLFEMEYEAPTGVSITTKLYVDLAVSAGRTITLAGSTPASATDRSFRLPINTKKECQLRAQFINMEITNAENVGAAMKINFARIYHDPLDRREEIKG